MMLYLVQSAFAVDWERAINLDKLKREAEIYNEKFRKTRQYAYADPAEMKMQRNKSIKEMLLAVCDAIRSKFPLQAGTIKRASQAA